MRIKSSAFKHGEFIPRPYSRFGEDESPPLTVEDVPVTARSLVLIMEDPDVSRGLFTHWIVFDLDPETEELGEDNGAENGKQGLNSWGEVQYGGPRPPSGEHRYFFRLYALDRMLNLPTGSERVQIEAGMKGHVIAAAELMGLYAAETEVMAH